MSIFRGTGGTGDGTNDATISEVTAKALLATTAASEAADSAASALSSAELATIKAAEAEASSQGVEIYATNSAASAVESAASAVESASSAASALTSETNAATSATASATSATAALASETAASASESAAAVSATTATTKAAEAATSATSASTSASTATTKASEAATSASNAATSETNAATSATSAATSATASSTSAAASATSATEAAASASSAALSEANIATEVSTAIADLVDSAPLTLDTLNELAAALGDDPNFATTVTNSIATKLPLAGGAMTGPITTNSTFDGRDVSVDGTKLDGIEANATADQTALEIKTAYESNADTNAFTDADETKLDGIEASATADQTAAEIKTAYESNADTNAFTDADHTKLDGIEASATADQTANEILTAVKTVDGSGSGLDADTVDGIQASSFVRSDVDDTMAGDLLMDSANAEINIKSGAAGTSGAVNWTFNTTGTNYASIKLPYDTRASTGLHIDSGYPITLDATTSMRFDISGSEKMRIDASGNLGLGTSAPERKLHIFNGESGALASNANSALVIEDDANAYISFLTPNFLEAGLLFGDSADNDAGSLTYNHLINRMSFRAGGASVLSIESTGIDVTGTATMDGLTVGDGHTIGEDLFDNLLIEASSGEGIRLVDNHATNPLTVDSNVGFRVQTILGTDRFFVDNSNGDISFYEDTGTTAKFFWDASAESLGIGTSSPSAKLEISGVKNTSEIRLSSTTNDSSWATNDYFGKLSFYSADASAAGAGIKGSIVSATTSSSGATPHMAFNVASTSSNEIKRMRIDASGNVLVGKTSASSNTIGFEAKPDGFIAATRSNNTVAIFNRTTADGSIVDFRKEGTSVGGIGVALSDNLYLSGVDAGIGCGTGNIYPATATGQPSDNDTDLGTSSTRFKDLYLSGGVRGNTLTFSNLSGAEKMRLFSNGNVSIGTTSSLGKLTVSNNGAEGIEFFPANFTNGNTVQHYNRSGAAYLTSKTIALDHRFDTSGTERMRIDSSGNLLVGKSATGTGTVGAELRANGFNAFVRDGGEVMNINRLSSDGTIIDFRKDSSTVGSIGTKSADLYIGKDASGLLFDVTGADGIRPFNTTTQSETDNTLDLGSTSSRFKDLYLSGDVRAGNRVYIQGSTTNYLGQGPYSSTNLAINFGNALFFYSGTTQLAFLSPNTANFTNQIVADKSAATTGTASATTISRGTVNTTTGYNPQNFHITFQNGGNVTKGSISSSHYATIYSTSSDYRLKEDLQPISNATERLLALNPVNFKWIDGQERSDGFIAHELQEHLPEAVTGEKDATTEVTETVVAEDGTETEVTTTVPEMQGIDQSKLVPLLVKTIQELEARITALENA